MDLPLLHWGLCMLHRLVMAGPSCSPLALLILLIHILHLTAEFSKLNLHSLPHFSLSTSRSDNVPISLSHTMIFTATKIKSFLMCYFDYCKRAETKQNGGSKCGVMKIKSSDGCLRVTGNFHVTVVSGGWWRKHWFQVEFEDAAHFKVVRAIEQEQAAAELRGDWRSHWVEVDISRRIPNCERVMHSGCQHSADLDVQLIVLQSFRQIQ